MSEPADFLRPSSYKKNLNEKLSASFLRTYRFSRHYTTGSCLMFHCTRVIFVLQDNLLLPPSR